MAYIDKVKAILENEYFRKDDGWHIDINDAKKNNGVVRSGIIIGNEKQTVAPVFYIDGYSENGYTEEAAAQDIYENYQKRIVEVKQMNENQLFQRLSQFNNIKDNICYKIVNTHANQKLFCNAPHFPITDDLSVMYYLQIERGATATITNQMLNVWGIDKKSADNKLWDYAYKNTMKQNPPDFFNIMDKLYPDMDKSDFDTSLYVLSNKDNIFGASVLLYGNTDILKDCLNKIQKETEHNYTGLYILPSSIHELIIIPDDGRTNDKNYMKQMVRDINRSELKPEEVLSDNVFYFDDKGFRQITHTIQEISR